MMRKKMIFLKGMPVRFAFKSFHFLFINVDIQFLYEWREFEMVVQNLFLLTFEMNIKLTCLHELGNFGELYSRH